MNSKENSVTDEILPQIGSSQKQYIDEDSIEQLKFE
jgi:hypothetical protein